MSPTLVRMTEMVDLRALSYFLAVAEEMSVTAAARRFHRAQPALSQAIPGWNGGSASPSSTAPEAACG